MYGMLELKKNQTKIECFGAKFSQQNVLGALDPALVLVRKHFPSPRGCLILVIELVHRGSNSILFDSTLFLGYPVTVVRICPAHCLQGIEEA